MNNQYTEALAEVDTILKVMPKDITEKIPLSFYNFISNNKSNTFQTHAIDDIFIQEDKLRNETKDILSLIYTAYLCDEAKRNELKKQDYMELQQYNEELNNKYSIENLFKKWKDNLDNNIKENVEETSIIILEDKKWYIKLFNKIKKLFSNIIN